MVSESIKASLLSVLQRIFILFIVFLSQNASAGFIEVGASGSYRKSNIGRDSFDESQSVTGSLSYYFDESSALELSYTDVINRRILGEGQPDGQLTNLYYKMIGLDLVLTMGTRESTVRPYIKVGGVYITDKRITTQYWAGGNAFAPNTRQDPEALVPSAGLGFKLAISKNWSLKVGVEAWSSRSISEDPMIFDYSGRVGLSWIF